MESNFRTAWNLVEPTCLVSQRSTPNTLRSTTLLDYSSAGLEGIPLPLTPRLCAHPLGETLSLPSEKLAAVSSPNSLLFKVPERNWSKSQLGEIGQLTFYLQSLPSMMEM